MPTDNLLLKQFSAWHRLCLTHWGWVTHICLGNLIIIGSNNGLSPGRRQAITWTNVGILLIGPLGKNFSEMLIKIHAFPFKKIYFKMSSGKWRPFSLGLNVLKKHLKALLYIVNTFTNAVVKLWDQGMRWGPLPYHYSISQEICTRFCGALHCCGYAIVYIEFTWRIYPYSSGLLCWHWGNR